MISILYVGFYLNRETILPLVLESFFDFFDISYDTINYLNISIILLFSFFIELLFFIPVNIDLVVLFFAKAPFKVYYLFFLVILIILSLVAHIINLFVTRYIIFKYLNNQVKLVVNRYQKDSKSFYLIAILTMIPPIPSSILTIFSAITKIPIRNCLLGLLINRVGRICILYLIILFFV